MRAIIILAAGNSTRMKSSLSKVLHPLAGQPVLQYVFDATNTLAPTQTIVVVSEPLKDHSVLAPYTQVVQTKALGTGHAVQAAIPLLNDSVKEVFIVCGDTPLMTPETLNAFSKVPEDLALIAMPVEMDTSYGRLVFDSLGRLRKIVEMKDATPAEKNLPLANTGVYKIHKKLLNSLVKDLTNNNASLEYYLTDVVEKAYDQNITIGFHTACAEEFHGINTRADLAKAHAILQNRWRHKLMDQGVTLVQPETVHLSFDTHLECDTTVGPFVTFGPGVYAQETVTILPFCHLEQCHLEKNVSVGPFAHIRGHSTLKTGASVGNFVEIKKSTLGCKTKAKHLAYIGDATLGIGVNVGAGTITCNYDGIQKYETIIDDNTLVGANVSLVAPLHIGQGSIIAAGSVITGDVDCNSLAIGRAHQVNKMDGAQKIRERQKKK